MPSQAFRASCGVRARNMTTVQPDTAKRIWCEWGRVNSGPRERMEVRGQLRNIEFGGHDSFVFGADWCLANRPSRFRRVGARRETSGRRQDPARQEKE